MQTGYLRPEMTPEQKQRFADLAGAVARDRDRTAFAELFDFFAPRLVAFLCRNGANRETAEELAQETMTVLWHKAHLFDASKATLSTWLFRIARNRRIDLARRDKSDRIDPADPIFQPEAQGDPGEQLDAEKRDERVRAALATLPHEQLILVRQAFFEGLSHSEIAERAGLPLGTVKSRIRLAFGRMRKALEADSKVDTDFSGGP